MATKIVEAIFEHGSFQLVDTTRFTFRDGQRVRLVVETEPTPDMILDLAAQVFSGLTPQELVHVEKIVLKRCNSFRKERECCLLW